ncbi:hypothetical protein K9M79_05285 [Candidatus Woesearchaeota archaeon]|nr:hypothetical protein [Candidatus Woesearchaeota archaeon]
MDDCYKCNIEYKIEYCCGSHPDTGISSTLELLDGRILNACPNLDHVGDCSIYNSRPEPCKLYECPKSYESDLFERMNLD